MDYTTLTARCVSPLSVRCSDPHQDTDPYSRARVALVSLGVELSTTH